MENEIIQFIQSNPSGAYFAVFGVLLACGLGVPIPEDISLIAGGYAIYLAQQAELSQPALIPMVGVGLVGVLTGDIILFMLGRWMGPRVTRLWPFRRLVRPHRMAKVYGFFSKYGMWTAFVARFAAGLRAPTYLLAGTARMSFRRFVLADASAALISVPLLVGLAYSFGAEIDKVKRVLAGSKYAVLGLVMAVALFLVLRALRDKRARVSAEVEAERAAHEHIEFEPPSATNPSAELAGTPAEHVSLKAK